MSVEKKMREQLISWASTANVNDMAKLPDEIFFPAKPVKIERAAEETAAPSASKAKPSRNRRRKRANGKISRELADSIRSQFSGVDRKSQKYRKLRDSIAREHGLSRRQVSSAVVGLERVKSARKPGAAKK